MISRLICKLFGHRWMGIGPLEHICITDICWRCRTKRSVHASGEWGHTSCPDGLVGPDA